MHADSGMDVEAAAPAAPEAGASTGDVWSLLPPELRDPPPGQHNKDVEVRSSWQEYHAKSR